jgi:aminoglycoside phosphotransferase (APT) family kinase protein
MSTIGDPLMDLGTSLGYWVQADDDPRMQALALSPTALPGNPSRAELIEQYQQATGKEVTEPVFYYVYGLFKVAVIIQQIYARYQAGLTQDERFAGLIHAVKAIADMAARAIDREAV